MPLESAPLGSCRRVPDAVAPGEDVLSAAPGGGWRTLSGSSMAVPHVAGLAALSGPEHAEARVRIAADLMRLDGARADES